MTVMRRPLPLSTFFATLMGALALLMPLSGPAEARTRDEVLAAAQAWVDDGVPYSYSAWYTDPTSGTCCYRSDCSGFVSAVWGIAPPGNTTYSFATGPWDDGVTYEIDASLLLPGDALNYAGDPGDGTGHIVLYVDGDFSSGWVEVYEEYSHGHDAVRRWRTLDPGIYRPIRYSGLTDCTDEVCDGVDNDCDGAIDEEYLCEIPDDPAWRAHRFDFGLHSDLDGDGRGDVCMRGAAGLYCQRWTGTAWAVFPTLTALSNANGFNAVETASTLRLADVTGDGLADVCARHPMDGLQCWPSTGTDFGSALTGPSLTDAAGWADPLNYATLRMADLDADGDADLCIRGDSGVLCYLSEDGSLSTRISGPEWSDALGWDAPKYTDTIRTGDIDGDGRADLCARAAAGMRCALFDGTEFSTYLAGPEWSDALGWDDPMYYSTIAMPDVNGDGRSDLCARSAAGIRCHTSTGLGFGPAMSGPELSNALGWDSFSAYSTLHWADLDGDGRDDLCARSVLGLRCWRSEGGGFAATLVGPEWSDENGWTDYSNYSTILAGDLDGDGRADVCARADAGLRCALGDDSGTPIGSLSGPEWSDAAGWDSPAYFGTLRFSHGRSHLSEEEDTGSPCEPAEEVCNGRDDDCDGTIDEGCPGWGGDSGPYTEDAGTEDTDTEDTDTENTDTENTADAAGGKGASAGAAGCATRAGPAGLGISMLTLTFLFLRQKGTRRCLPSTSPLPYTRGGGGRSPAHSWPFP
jgi:hypothetical protein